MMSCRSIEGFNLGWFQGATRNSFFKSDQTIDLNRRLTEDERQDDIFWFRSIYILTWFTSGDLLARVWSCHCSRLPLMWRERTSWQMASNWPLSQVLTRRTLSCAVCFPWSVCLNVITAVIFLDIVWNATAIYESIIEHSRSCFCKDGSPDKPNLTTAQTRGCRGALCFVLFFT